MTTPADYDNLNQHFATLENRGNAYIAATEGVKNALLVLTNAYAQGPGEAFLQNYYNGYVSPAYVALELARNSFKAEDDKSISWINDVVNKEKPNVPNQVDGGPTQGQTYYKRRINYLRQLHRDLLQRYVAIYEFQKLRCNIGNSLPNGVRCNPDLQEYVVTAKGIVTVETDKIKELDAALIQYEKDIASAKKVWEDKQYISVTTANINLQNAQNAGQQQENEEQKIENWGKFLEENGTLLILAGGVIILLIIGFIFLRKK